MSDLTVLKKNNLNECATAFLNNILQNKNFDSSLKEWCSNGEADLKAVRSTSLKYFLGLYPSDISSWPDAVASIRSEYKAKFKKFCTIKKISGDPWGGNKPSTKKKDDSLEEENEWKRIINLDLSRTYQDIDQFTKHTAKSLWANVWFIWSKENKDISYKQGMNELLAVFYLAWYPYYFKSTAKPKPTPAVIKQYLESPDKMNIADIYTYFNDEDEMQSDWYFLFDNLMKKGIKDLFVSDVIKNKKSPEYTKYELFPKQIKDDTDEDVPTYINRRCALLIKEKLQNIDEELFNYFNKIDWSCSIFLQRWLRCVFNREFDHTEVLLIWDAVFANQDANADKYDWIFIDYWAIAMIIRIRDELFVSDQNECFTKLFKYPKVENIVDIIKLGEKVQKGINESIKYNRKACVYQTLGIVRPIKARPKTNEEENTFIYKERNAKGNQAELSNPQAVDVEKEEVINQFDQDEAENTENYDGGFLGIGNALNSLGNFGGIIREIKEIGAKVTTTVTEHIENFTNERSRKGSEVNNLNGYANDNSGDQQEQQQFNEENESNNYETRSDNSNGNNSQFSNPYEIIAKWEQIKNKYGMYMGKEDKTDFETIIKLLKSNVGE